MTGFRDRLRCATLLMVVCLQPAAAAIVSDSLGNTMPGFSAGSTPAASQVGHAQEGRSAPFDRSYGTDVDLGSGVQNFSRSWEHSYASIAAPILNASITFGIYDHDSSASGSQLAAFTVDDNDLTVELDELFETTGEGRDGMYNEYTIQLGSVLFADLADGSALLSLSLTGPGLVTELFGIGTRETAGNGASMVFSTLTIETLDSSVVPIPAALPLFASTLLLIGLLRLRPDLWRH